MKTVEQYREAFLDHLNSKLFVKEPRNFAIGRQTIAPHSHSHSNRSF